MSGVVRFGERLTLCGWLGVDDRVDQDAGIMTSRGLGVRRRVIRST